MHLPAAGGLPALLGGKAMLGQAPAQQRLRAGDGQGAWRLLQRGSVEQPNQPLVGAVGAEAGRQRHHQPAAGGQFAAAERDELMPVFGGLPGVGAPDLVVGVFVGVVFSTGVVVFDAKRGKLKKLS